MFDCRFAVLAVVLALGMRPPPLGAQTSPNIEKLAALTAKRVAKTHAQHVLIAALKGCLLNTGVCAALDAALHTTLKNAISSVDLVSREKVVGLLKNHGLLDFDCYDNHALRAVTSEAGAEVLIAEDLRWKPDAYELITQVFDAQGNELHQFKVIIPRSAPDSDELPLILKDPETGASLVIPKRKEPHSRYFPSCEECPIPRYASVAREKGLQGMVTMLATITERGVPDHIVVLEAFDDSVTTETLKTIKGWRFKPGLGPDGKPFAVRITIEVTYHLR